MAQKEEEEDDSLEVCVTACDEGRRTHAGAGEGMLLLTGEGQQVVEDPKRKGKVAGPVWTATDDDAASAITLSGAIDVIYDVGKRKVGERGRGS